MRNFARVTWLFASTHFLRGFVSRRGLVCIALALVPVLLALAVAHFATRTSSGTLATHLAWHLSVQIVVPVLSLIAGSAVIAEEIEDRTITYLFSTPVPRAALLVGRWLSTCFALTVILAATTGLCLIAAEGARAAGPRIDAAITIPLLTAVCAGAAVYSLVFAVLGVFFRHPMIVGLGYCFAVEALVANLPGEIRTLSIQHYVRSLIASQGSAVWKPLTSALDARYETSQDAALRLAVIFCVALALGVWGIRRREILVTS